MVVFVNQTPRRLLLVKGGWSLSWRNSKKNLIPNDSMDEDCCKKTEANNGNAQQQTQIKKNVQFMSDTNEEGFITEIEAEECPITYEEMKNYWYQSDDYTRFEKDRVLTSLGYMARHRISGGITFDDNIHSIRGIESMCDAKLSRRQIGERNDLLKAIKLEEQRQKSLDASDENDDSRCCFPDMDHFRRVSLKHTKSATQRAIALGQQDAMTNRSTAKAKNPMVVALRRGLFRRGDSAVWGTGSGHTSTTIGRNNISSGGGDDDGDDDNEKQEEQEQQRYRPQRRRSIA